MLSSTEKVPAETTTLLQIVDQPLALFGPDGELLDSSPSWRKEFGESLQGLEALDLPTSGNLGTEAQTERKMGSQRWSFRFRQTGQLTFVSATKLTSETGTRPESTADRGRIFQLFMKAPAPVAVLRGPDQIFEFANESYRQLIGAVRDIDGLPIEVALPDVDKGLIGILRGVYTSGERYIGNVFPVTLDWGLQGKTELKYFSFVFEPMLDQDGAVTGVMVFGFEVTDQVTARETLTKLNDELEARVRERTVALSAANQELEAFSYSVSHDLRSPLRGVDGFSQALLEDYGSQLDSIGREYLEFVRAGVQRMGDLIDDLLRLSRLSRTELAMTPVDLSSLAEEVTLELRQGDPAREVEILIEPGMKTKGDRGLLRAVLQNLVGNAWKFTARRSHPRITVGQCRGEEGEPVFYVEDNGAGFDMAYTPKLFGAFQRLHSPDEGFTGTGIGLATVRRIIHRHGGRIWAKGEVGKGATFFFTV